MKKFILLGSLALLVILLLVPAGCRTSEDDAIEIITIFRYEPGMPVPTGGWALVPTTNPYPDNIQRVLNPGDEMYLGLRISDRIEKEITFTMYTIFNESTEEEVNVGSANDLGSFEPGRKFLVAFDNPWPVPDIPGTYKLNIYLDDSVIASARFEVTPATTPASFDRTTASMTTANGLALTISLNATNYQPGEPVFISIDESNTLDIRNNIPADDKWPVQGLSVGFCGTLNYPFGLAIFKGYYLAENIAEQRPLQLYDPDAVYHCPSILAGIASYDFQPQSSMASIYTVFDNEPVSIGMNTNLTATGFWTGSTNAAFSYFTPGVYTVVGGDEWGALVVLHFVISDAPVQSLPSVVTPMPEPETTTQNSTASQNVTIAELLSRADACTGATVTLDAYYFDAIFKGSRLADAVSLDESGTGEVIPVGETVFLSGILWEGIKYQLYTQGEILLPDNTEYFGRLRITGTFYRDEINKKYGIKMIDAEVLDWEPPRKGNALVNGDLEIKIRDYSGELLEGVEVDSLIQPEGQTQLDGLTGVEGKVIFNDVKQGSYEFSVNITGYMYTHVELTVTGGRTASPTFIISRLGESPDDLMPAPGLGPQYRANIQQVGSVNPWLPIIGATVTLDASTDTVLTYRDFIETIAGETRNNMFIISQSGAYTDDAELEVTVTPSGLPSGITVTQVWQWCHGKLSKTAMQLETSLDIPSGEYSFGFGVAINGQYCGIVPCTIKILK